MTRRRTATATGEPPATSRATYPPMPQRLPDHSLEQGRYRVRFARNEDDLERILRLRFEVFNLELGEGLDESFDTGLDRDMFDASCHHLLVEDVAANLVIGTYRMQTADMAGSAGFYSEGEFDLGTLPESVRGRAVETGRACIGAGHRNRMVLFLLWQGLALYIKHNEMRYLFGCCSLTSQDPDEGQVVLRFLADGGFLHPRIRVAPRAEVACVPSGRPYTDEEIETVKLPKLFRTYLRYGAKACGEPAIDRLFKTIDFFVLLDREEMDPVLRRLFL